MSDIRRKPRSRHCPGPGWLCAGPNVRIARKPGPIHHLIAQPIRDFGFAFRLLMRRQLDPPLRQWNARERRVPLVCSFQQFGCEFAKQVLYREAGKSDCNASLGMAEIVESSGQIQIAHESTGSRPYEIRKRDSVVRGIRFVHESKCQRVKASHEWILAGGWPVTEIFMKKSNRQEPPRLQ
jgi:hypothetical protein